MVLILAGCSGEQIPYTYTEITLTCPNEATGEYEVMEEIKGDLDIHANQKTEEGYYISYDLYENGVETGHYELDAPLTCILEFEQPETGN